jgi:RHS repeat-associated protein
VSDRKIAVDANNDNIADYFLPDVVSATDYYCFGAPMPSRSFNSNSYNRGFNGKEKDDEINVGGGSYDFGARMYDSRLGRMLSIDPMASASIGWNPYHAFNDNPISNVDPTGKFSINNHYNMTNNALKKMGYSDVVSDLIAHYSSVFADHPEGWITWAQRNYYRDGYNYAPTTESQNTASKENSTWHSMTSDGENISNHDAMGRGQSFGWSKIIEASAEIGKSSLGIAGLTKNSKGAEALGQGLHALQDAVAHKGVDMAHHDVVNDMYPSDADYAKAEDFTASALVVADVMGGHYGRLQDGMNINLTGTTMEQYNQITQRFQDAIDSHSKAGKKMTVTFTGKPEEKK